nr:3-oxoacyl-[acyl-carrier-protein] synthase [Ipomoea batatas]
MGNYVSCTLSGPVGRHSSKGTKVILPTGEIRHFYEPTNAAELMLESPNHFVVSARGLQMGRRFSALNADEDLEMGGVYAMFPMKRLNSAVTAADMGVLFLAAKRVSRGSVRILPDHQIISDGGDQANVDLPRLNLDELEELSAPEFKHRMSMCRSKKPMLETIVEEPVYSR